MTDPEAGDVLGALRGHYRGEMPPEPQPPGAGFFIVEHHPVAATLSKHTRLQA